MAYIGVSPSNGVRRVHTYTATASQTTFSGAGAEGATLSYKDSNFVDVYQNGVKLGDADYTATSGTSIVLGTGASASDLVVIVVFDVFSVADTVSKADGGTFDGNVTMGGTLAVTGTTAFTGSVSGLDVNGTEIILDADADTSITSDTDDQIDFKCGGIDRVIIGADGSFTSQPASNGTIVFNEASNDVDFRVESNDNANMLFVDGGNNKVGIGTNSPSSGVEISGVGLAVGSGCTASGTAGSMAVGHASSATGSRSFVFGRELTVSGDHAFGVALSDLNGQDFSTNNCMAILGGNLEFGTTSINNLAGFGVASASLAARIDIQTNFPSYNPVRIKNNHSGDNGVAISFLNNAGGAAGSISQTNASTISFNTSSDYRLKENLNYDWDATSLLKQLKPTKFNWIADKDNTEIMGFIAHEVSDIVPQAVEGVKDGTRELGVIKEIVKDKDGKETEKLIRKDALEINKEDGQTWEKTKDENVYQTIDHSKLVPLLVKTIQELEARIAILESK
tara:strand:- start:182 stop:1708 length:1527 start_codon:yes stop_codon:yes gene_type:complete